MSGSGTRARAALEQGRPDDALRHADRAIARDPVDAFAHEARGLALNALGRTEEAIRSYQDAIRLAPAAFGPRYNLGNAFHGLARYEDAIGAYRRAVAANGGMEWAWNNLGDSFLSLGCPSDAADAFAAAVLLRPDIHEMRFNLGRALVECQRFAEAERILTACTEARPADGAAWYHLGRTLGGLVRWDQAAEAFANAARLNPDDAMTWHDLAYARHRAGQFDEAIAAIDVAVTLAPSSQGMLTNRGHLLYLTGRFPEAEARLREVTDADPLAEVARFNLAVLYLASGRYRDGWRLWEARWTSLNKTRPLTPVWDGAPAADAVVLVHEDQGFGDFLQFCRFVPSLTNRCGTMILRVPQALERLMASLPGSQGIVSAEDFPRMATSWDLACAITDLPALTDVTPDAIPAPPYLFADPALTARWRDRLDEMPGFKVGLVWAGNPEHVFDSTRSMAFADLAPLADVAGVSFVSLQKGGAAWTARQPGQSPELVDVADELTDYAETAALIAALDLVITVDTSVVHLAGALDKPVWLLSAIDADWRWPRGREDSPWYPSVRVFHQTRPRDWRDPLSRVVDALRTMVAAR